MIKLTRLNHEEIILNCDLIEFIESSPDTILTLQGGKKMTVTESVDEVIERIIEFKRKLFKHITITGT